MKDRLTFLLLFSALLISAYNDGNNISNDKADNNNTNNKNMLAKINSAMNLFSKLKNGCILFKTTSGVVKDSNIQVLNEDYTELLFRKNANSFDYMMTHYSNNKKGLMTITTVINGLITTILKDNNVEDTFESIQEGFSENKISPPTIMKLFFETMPGNKYIKDIQIVKENNLTGFKIIINYKFLQENNHKLTSSVDITEKSYAKILENYITYWLNNTGQLVKVDKHEAQPLMYLDELTISTIDTECKLPDYNKN